MYNLNLFYPCYKYVYLLLIQIQLYKSIDAIPFSWHKLDCTLLCSLCHKDGLKVNNNISSTPRLVNNIPFCGSMQKLCMFNEYFIANLSYKLFDFLLIRTQLHKHIHVFPFSCCKFDYSRRCFLHHTDVLRMDNKN